MNDIINSAIHGDCKDIMKRVPNEFISSCITDPPYNYEFIGHNNWDEREVRHRKSRVDNSSNNILIKHISYGSGLSGGVRNERWYRKNRDGILEYQQWCLDWGTELFRVYKPGTSAIIFNGTRTIARVQAALERAEFYTRDVIIYRRASGVPKGLSLERKLEKQGYYDKGAEGLHSCLRNEWKTIYVLQKPLRNNCLQTCTEYGIGLFYTKMESEGFRPNIIKNIKKDAPLGFNIHTTTKPLGLTINLSDTFVPKDGNTTVLDPFSGSGTTSIVAREMEINFLRIGIEPRYIEIINKRLKLSQQINRRRA